MSTNLGTHPTDAASDRPGRVVDDLIGHGLVHPQRRAEAVDVVTRSLGTAATTGEPRGASGSARGRLVEVAGYLGGALVVAALGLFLADHWIDLGDTGQVVALVVITLLLAGAGAVVASIGSGYAAARAGRDDVRRRLASALLTGAAVAGAVTVGRVVDLADVGGRWSSWPGFLGGVAMVVLGAVAYRVLPSAIAQAGLAGGAFTAVVSSADVVGSSEGTVPGLMILALGGVWVVLSETGVFREVVVGRAIGSALAVLGAQMPLFDGPAGLAYALTAAVAVAGFALYLRTTAWPYLVAGVLAVTVVVPEAIIDWTDGSLGAGGAVLVAGLTLLGASAAGFRVRQETHED